MLHITSLVGYLVTRFVVQGKGEIIFCHSHESGNPGKVFFHISLKIGTCQYLHDFLVINLNKEAN